MRRYSVILALVVAVLSVLAYAWFDAGREPVRLIAEPVTVPGAVK